MSVANLAKQKNDPRRDARGPDVAIEECVCFLHGHVDSDRNSRVAAVEHVVAVVHVVNVHVVGFIPGRSPVFGPWIDDAEPETSILEARVSAHDQDGGAMNAKPVTAAKTGAEACFRNAVSTVSAAFMPAPMLVRPVARAMVLPNVVPVVPLLVPLAGVLLPVAVAMFPLIVSFMSFIAPLMPASVLFMFF